MDLAYAINCALEGEALLFAGSGFSYGAKNIKSTHIHVGDKLRDIIAADCGVVSQRPLSVISQFYTTERSVGELIELLKTEFTVSTVAQWHEKLLSVSWKRIYTTNYDSVIELAAQNNGRKLIPIVLSDEIKSTDINNICVHLNGYIDRLNKDSIHNEFKLIDTSYSCDSLVGNEWYDLFKDDLQTAKAIFIVGYSMQFDIDIKRLLSSKAIREKVIFINNESSDIVDKRLLECYGHCEFIGVEEFSNKVIDLRKSYIAPISMKKFQSFIYEYRATMPSSILSFSEINSFYTRGEYNESLMSKSHGDYKYIVLRKAIDIVIRKYFSTKVFLAISDLGNGKTMFCNLVRNELREHEVDVFTFAHNFHNIDEEIERISSQKKRHSIVIIDDFKGKEEVIRKFKYRDTSKISFVITTRRSVNPGYRVLQNLFGVTEKEILILNLDVLNGEEVASLSQVITNNDLYNSHMTNRSSAGIERYICDVCHSRFADLLLDAYKSSDIKERISKIWADNLEETLPIRRLTVLALMKSVMGIDFNFSEMLDLLRIDYALVPARESSLLQEFFNVDKDDIIIKSSVVARELLQSAVGIIDLLDTMKTAMIEADREYQVNGSYYELLRNLVSHSHFRLFEATSDNQAAIMSFYDEIRNLEFCKKNLFYWEQFASACIEFRDFPTANQCIENAFSLAKENPGFVPFHIENIKANYLIEKVLFESSNSPRPSASEVISALIECHDRLLKHFNHPDNNISYTFRVGAKYAKLFDIFKDEFDVRQKSIFMEKKVGMLRLMIQHQKSPEFVGHPLSTWIEDLKKCE